MSYHIDVHKLYIEIKIPWDGSN